jgi:hypothetical protein
MLQPLQLAEFVGFSEDGAKNACKQRFMGFDEIKIQYDDYRFGELHIFNPMSVSNALKERLIGNYWTQSESYESMKPYLCMDFGGQSFTTADDVFTMLVHLGYLGYNFATSDISMPNNEVESIFRELMHDTD